MVGRRRTVFSESSTDTQMSQAAWSDRDRIQSALSAFRARARGYWVQISLDTRMYLDVNDEFDRLESETTISTDVLVLGRRYEVYT